MKIVSPLPHKKARLEIVPLIDIMFFLLASFMMVSLTMTKQRTVTVNLPGASTAQTSLKPDTLSLAVGSDARVYFEKTPIELPQLEALLRERLAKNPELPIYISGDTATPHGSMVAVLDYVRRCGANKVAFTVKPVDAAP